MEEIVLKIKDKKKVAFLRKLLSQFDFVEVEKEKVRKMSKHSIFESAGLWRNRSASELELRKMAWNREK